jgi:hypothetical protein
VKRIADRLEAQGHLRPSLKRRERWIREREREDEGKERKKEKRRETMKREERR